MATLKNNGAVVLHCLKGRVDWRIMSNGSILSKRPGRSGGFRKIGKVKPGLTFAEVEAILHKSGWTIFERSQAWLDLKPAPVKRIMRKAPPSAPQDRWVDRVNPGLLRAMVKQGKVK